ncbi:MAG TPA: 50S ribosomal protein L2 [Candidatus Goldiibacteriota bacterium]|nr:50S ribosomal protein L2 [Candidatus Goldiibacteriota bacterium]HPI03958.1 50S ribosomal protein L2 [Candidatus Goldiibacteriota bacterium]HRQ42972.1 50S ribosomal protein L2 [Candidatus Goldiibacteriota bacterium]
MGIKSFRPITPSRRMMTVDTKEDVTKDSPEKSLTINLNNKTGRNSLGRITSRFRGGGHRKLYRIIDFKRDKFEVPAVVTAIEYDPYRTCRIALLSYKDGDKRYIVAPVGLNVGDTVVSSDTAEIKTGNSLSLNFMPVGTIVHNIEITPGKGGQIARGAGSFAQIMGKEGEHVVLKMPSGELRMVMKRCRATVGQVGNTDHENIIIGKAGRNRWRGIKPRNRAMAMNPVDHPMGGGEGKSKSGAHPCSPTGVKAKGFKTRDKKKYSNKYIIRRRKAKTGGTI